MDLGHRSGDRFGHNSHVLRIESAFIIGCAVAYVISQVWLKPYLHSDFFQGYFNDIVAGAALSVFSIMLIRQRFRPSFAWIATFVLLIVSVAGCYWEYFAPRYRAISVSDPLDFAAYYAGACLYLAFEFTFEHIRLKSHSCEEP